MDKQKSKGWLEGRLTYLVSRLTTLGIPALYAVRILAVAQRI